MIRTGALFLALAIVPGCMEPRRSAQTALSADPDRREFREAGSGAGAETEDPSSEDEEIAIEEMEMEDAEALSLLIADKLASTGPRRRTPEAGTGALDAARNSRLGPAECLERLERAEIRFEKPTFETPGVKTPLLLIGPVDGVSIEPRWPKSGNVNAVIDCHLMLALEQLARQAKGLGVKKILYYSIYRPVAAPPGRCAPGQTGARCRRLGEAYRKSRKSPSQHRAALAIDIGWLVMEDDERIDLSEHFDRRPGVNPCSYQALGDKARILQELACTLYQKGVFNVMLTPNANRAHHNHFHFDITPDADWSIIR